MSTAGDGEFPVAQRQARREADLTSTRDVNAGPTSFVRRPLLTSLGRTTAQAIELGVGIHLSITLEDSLPSLVVR